MSGFSLALRNLLGGAFGQQAAQPNVRPLVSSFPHRYLPDNRFVPHTIKGTMAYISQPKPAAGLTEYIADFARNSPVMRQLDETMRPIKVNIGVRRSGDETYPNVIVDLAKHIPADRGGGLGTRGNFLSTNFGLSLTFSRNLDAFKYHLERGLDVDVPGAVWAVRRALRALEGDIETQNQFIAVLGERYPTHAHSLLRMQIDAKRSPVFAVDPVFKLEKKN